MDLLCTPRHDDRDSEFHLADVLGDLPYLDTLCGSEHAATAAECTNSTLVVLRSQVASRSITYL